MMTMEHYQNRQYWYDHRWSVARTTIRFLTADKVDSRVPRCCDDLHLHQSHYFCDHWHHSDSDPDLGLDTVESNSLYILYL